MKVRKLELPCEQAAYWLIKTYITKAYEISRLNNSSKDEQDFSKIIRGISLYNWNTIFMILSSCIRNINSREPFSQTTSKDKHILTDVIIEETLEKLGILGTDEKLPKINLTERQGTCSAIDMGIDARNVFVSSKKGRSKLPKYTINYDFVLSSDDSELRFYNLILSIIVSVRRKNNRINSLNIIKEVFCERANVHDAAIVFDRVIEVLREYSIIKLETKGKKDIITKWPIDEKNISEDYYSDLILEKYNESLASNIKDYVPPITRKERRLLIGEPSPKKTIDIEKILSLELNGIFADFHKSIEYFDDGRIKVYRAPDEDNRLDYSVSYNVLSPNDFSVIMPLQVDSRKENCQFMLQDDIVTITFGNIEIQENLINGKRFVTIEDRYGDIIIRYEAELLEDHLVCNRVNIRMNNSKYSFNNYQFTKIWSYIQKEIGDTTSVDNTVPIDEESEEVDDFLKLISDVSERTEEPANIVVPDGAVYLGFSDLLDDDTITSDSTNEIPNDTKETGDIDCGVDVIDRIPAGYKTLYDLYSIDFNIINDINNRLTDFEGINFQFDIVETVVNSVNDILKQAAKETSLPSLKSRMDRYLKIINSINEKGKYYLKELAQKN